MNLQEEREASRLRGEGRRNEDMAMRLTQHLAPPGSSIDELEAVAREKWQQLSDCRISAIMQVIKANREEFSMPRGVNPAREARTKILHAWLRKVLTKDIDLDFEVVYKRAKKAGFVDYKSSSFRTGHFYPIRKEVWKKLHPGEKMKGRGIKGVGGKRASREPVVLNEKPIDEVDAQGEEKATTELHGDELPHFFAGKDMICWICKAVATLDVKPCIQDPEARKEILGADGCPPLEAGDEKKLEPKGEVPDDHPLLQNFLKKEDGKPASQEEGRRAVYSGGPDDGREFAPRFDEHNATFFRTDCIPKWFGGRYVYGGVRDSSGREMWEWEPGMAMGGEPARYPGDDRSLLEGRTEAPRPFTSSDIPGTDFPGGTEPAAKMSIDSPRGTIEYRMDVHGAVSVELHSPSVESFLTLMEFLDALIKPLTGATGPPLFTTIPSIVEDEDEVEVEE